MNELTKEYLKRIVPERIFWRGEDLYNDEAVKNVKVTETRITASVLGSRRYTVTAERTEDGFLFSCTCPYEYFCKHQIALGLWIAENKKAMAKWKAPQPGKGPVREITNLLEKAAVVQKEKFLADILEEFPVLLKRFEVMVKGAANLGKEIRIDSLAKEIRKAIEDFDLEDFTRFYESAPEAYGYREDWQVLQDGAQAEFEDILSEYKAEAMELLETRNIIGSFKYILALYEAVNMAAFEDIIDPACVYEAEGLYDLAETIVMELVDEFTNRFAALSIEEQVYMKLLDVYFDRFNKKNKRQIYQFSDFNPLLLSGVKTKNSALHLLKSLRKSTGLTEEDYCELLLAAYEQTEEEEKWLKTAEKYYMVNQAVAEKSLRYFEKDKGRLIPLARDMAFRFGGVFIPFFYEKLNKKDSPELYKKILSAHAKKEQTLKLYKELKNGYGPDAAWEFINGLEKEWGAERFYIRLLKEEKAYERLLTQARKKSKTTPALEYLSPIVNIYPEQVFTLISTLSEKYLDENLGRNYYRQTAEWLKLLNKIKDKKAAEKARKFIGHLYEKFSNRRAMKDEFDKAGVR